MSYKTLGILAIHFRLHELRASADCSSKLKVKV